MTASRTSKTLQNARVGALCYLLSLFVSFFSRRIFLDQLGAEFLGYTSSVGSFLNFLNIAELGISGAVTIAFYKPLFDDNREQINELVSILGYLYRWVGFFIGVCGIILSFFLPLLFPSVSFPLSIVYFGYYSFLIATLLGYFANYHSVLLAADQRNYEVIGYYQVAYTLKVIIQWIVTIYLSSFFLFLLLELVFGIVYSLLLHWRVRNTYPWLSSHISAGKELLWCYPQVVTKVRQSVAHCLGGFVQTQSLPLFIYYFVSLPTVALYGNYLLVSGSLRTCLRTALSSMNGGIGSLISEGDLSRIIAVYWEVLSLHFVCAGVVTGCFYHLLPDFISLWLGPEYLLPPIISVLVSLHLFLLILRLATDDFLFGFGLIQDIWSPVVESVVFITASSVLGHVYGLPGVLSGPLLSLLLVIHLWKPFFLFTRGFHLPVTQYFIRSLYYFIILAASFAFTEFFFYYLSSLFNQPCNTWLIWLGMSIQYFVVFSVLTIGVYWICFPEFRSLVRRLISVIRCNS